MDLNGMSAYMTDMIFISALCAGKKEVTNMPDKLMLSAEDVAALLSIAKPTAYALIRRLNNELEAKGFIVISGKVSTKYLYERLGLEADETA